ncbi:MAG: exopolysaccharide biosynthesis polyprenyl glycosylphosphotransferase [Leeuwenhoekiella sp.]
MRTDSGSYSPFIRPILYTLDAAVIVFWFIQHYALNIDILLLLIYAITVYFVSTIVVGYYEVYRFTTLMTILQLWLRQVFLYCLFIFAFFGWNRYYPITSIDVLIILAKIALTIAFIKISAFNLLKKYRILAKRNYRKVVIVGNNSQTKNLKAFFEENPVYGYRLSYIFDTKKKFWNTKTVTDYVIKEKIDEIYCSIAELKDSEINALLRFSEDHLKLVKFIPDVKEIFTKKLEYQYYGLTPILSLEVLAVDQTINRILKRTFDIVISLFVIVLLLSWIAPIVSVLILLESKGPVFYKQKRNGLRHNTFYCLKFRSMKKNDDTIANQVVLNDKRVTKIGYFLRKTSIDELPQFINVLMGDMSVVGPRPHPLSQTKSFANSVNKFMVRHLVKPGITGLAQVSGYRGEIRTPRDIKNRVRFDIFYLENWSILMDLRIIAKTIVQIFKGDPKAY